ncbi:MAG: efflux RND transporter periplasmic adaptor subunit [Herminiimonas sp.]|nr:efflux RND transporter periplasmic adaptor subunit [Herminiimonas sp.]
MHALFKYSLTGAGVLAAGAAVYVAAKGKPEPATKPPREQVQVVKTATALKKSVPIIVSANGYVTAINTVDVRPQIQNVVRTVHVTEGQDVKAGQLLFTLDQRSDLSSLANAEAQVARVRADLADAEATLQRNQELLSKGFVSQAVVDTARNKADSLRASLKGNQVAVQSGNITLGFNQIKAGISGRIGAIGVFPGSLAQPAGTPMLTISQIDPVAVTFAVPERELAYIVASYPKRDAPVVATLSNNEEINGKLVFIDSTADVKSGSIKMKAQFLNSDRKMWPGSFVTVRMVSRTLPDAVVIPSQSIVTGPLEKFVYTVQTDSTVKMQKVTVVDIQNEQAAVEGLIAGTRIVVEGTQNLRPGGKIRDVDRPGAPVAAVKEAKALP